MQKLLLGATGWALAAFLLIFFWSEGQSIAVRLTTALLVSGGGFVAGGLLTLVMTEKEDHGTHPGA